MWKKAMIAVLPCVGVASGDILSVSGDVELIAAPASVEPGELESDAVARVFIERDELLTETGFFVDISEPGSVSPNGTDSYPTGSLSVSDVPPGTLVESVYVHTDAVTPNTPFAGSISFDREVIGLIVRTQTLNDTDALVGAPATAYGSARAIGFLDTVTISGDRTTVSFDFRTGDGTDQIRILVSADPPCNAADLAPIFGRLDLADVTTFVAAFASGDGAGDLNGDGLLDLTDVTLFIQAFVAGCP